MPDQHEGHPASGHVQPLDPPRSSAGCTLFALVAVAVLSYGGYRYYKSAGPTEGAKTAKSHPVPVRVAKVTTMTVPVEVHGVGNVLAYSTVSVTAQVTGELMKVFFKEGDFVNKGQPLFAIDQRPQQASVEQLEATVQKDTAQIGQLQATVDRDRANVAQSRATLLRDEATAHFAKAEESRYHLLQKQGYVTVEQYQQELASLQTAAATVTVDQANIDSAIETMKADQASINSQVETRASDEASLRNAKVQLTYTYITSPVTGRTGGLSVYAGNVVNPGTTQPLVTIYQVKPIYITFAVPEQYLTLIQTLQARKPLEVKVDFNDEQTAPEWGKITFIDNNVDTTTGTIALRGTFPNTSLHLWPGRFVTVTLMLENEVNAVVVPSQAVQPGQNGDYVFVVDPDDTVEMKSVKVERIVGLNSVIKSGVTPGETVVTDGQLELNPKTEVEILNGKSHGGPEASGSPQDGASGSPEAAGSGSPEAAASGAPGGHHHHHHGGGPEGGSPSDAPEVSGSPGDTTMIQHGLPALSAQSGPLAIPTDPLGAGPAIPPCATPAAVGFPAGTGTPGLVMIANPAAQTAGASGPSSAAALTAAAAPTGLPGSVNQPGIVTTPGTLNTLQPVALPAAAPALTVGPPNIPSPGPASAVLPDMATPTAAPSNTPLTVATPTATATAPAATSTSAATSASNSTATGSTSTSGSTKSSAGGKSGH